MEVPKVNQQDPNHQSHVLVGLYQQIMIKGGNDSEEKRSLAIIDQFKNNEKTYEEAYRELNGMSNSKSSENNVGEFE